MSKRKLNWIKLENYTYPEIWAGDKLKVKNLLKDDEETILMFFDPLDDQVSLGLVVIIGHYAGTIEYLFPTESSVKGSTAISVQWLQEYWGEYNEKFNVKISDVTILRNDEMDTSFLDLSV